MVANQVRSTARKKPDSETVYKLPKPKRQSSSTNLKLVNPSLEKQRFTVYSTSPSQRFIAKLDKLSKILANFAIIGLVSAATSYACMASLEFKVSKELKNLEVEIKNREDLKSYVSKAYSWENLYIRAKKSHLVEAEKIEISTVPKSIFHLTNVLND